LFTADFLEMIADAGVKSVRLPVALHLTAGISGVANRNFARNTRPQLDPDLEADPLLGQWTMNYPVPRMRISAKKRKTDPGCESSRRAEF
jgi:hypothetical protein